MWRLGKLWLLLLLTLAHCGSYLEFQLYRMPMASERHELQPISCKSAAAINKDAEYKEICFEKDIAYIMPFERAGKHIALAADLTTPLSWIKAEGCVIDGTADKCSWIIETFGEKVRDVRKKVTSKFHKKSEEEEKENAIIEGSSQIIKGELQQSKSISFITKDSNRLTNFLQVLMLGLFIQGETDNLVLESTNFISATAISQNLNKRSDGAISMRLDQSSEKSFLNQIFSYIKSAEKVVSIYIGDNRTLTIGDLTSKYTQQGFSSINWVDTGDDEGFGRLGQITNVGIEDSKDDSDEQLSQALPAIFTLSASYLGLPDELITSIISKTLGKLATCKVDKNTLYLECSSSNKKNLEQIMNKHLYFTLSGANLMLPISDLIIKNDHGKRIVFNIKKSYNNHIIFGEPVFQKYAVFFDYSKNRIGYALKREKTYQFLNIVALIRFICLTFLVGCSMLVCFKPCRKFLREFKGKQFLSGSGGQEGLQLRQYSPIQENPYQQLKGKIQEVISSTDKEFEQG